MIIRIPKEIKKDEYRVAITPAGVKELTKRGHKVLIEKDAGSGSNIPDNSYATQGAKIEKKAASVWRNADLVLKVKEPTSDEYPYLREDLTIFTYLHLAAARTLTENLIDKKVTAIGYETVEHEDGRLPLLQPMSEIAGRMAPLVASYFLERMKGGRGTLLSGVAGVLPGKVVIIGAGIVGMNAAILAMGMGAKVVVIDSNITKLDVLEKSHFGRLRTLASNELNIENEIKNADVLIGAVLIPGAKAPKLVTAKMVKSMLAGSIIVDVSVDQGGCIETVRPTTHSDPIFEKYGVLHYGVTNMPGAVPRTSTYALTNATLPWVIKIAESGVEDAVIGDQALQKGVNTIKGHLTIKPVASAFHMRCTPLESILPLLPFRVI